MEDFGASAAYPRGRAGKSTVVKNHNDDVRNTPVSAVTSVAPVTGIAHFGSRAARSANSFVAIAP